MEQHRAKKMCLGGVGTEIGLASSSSKGGFDLNEQLHFTETKKHGKMSPTEQQRPAERPFFQQMENAGRGCCQSSERAKEFCSGEQDGEKAVKERTSPRQTDFSSRGKSGVFRGKIAPPAKEKERKQASVSKFDEAKLEDLVPEMVRVMQNGANCIDRCKTPEYAQLIPVQECLQKLLEVVMRSMNRAREQEMARSEEKAAADRSESQGEIQRLQNKHEDEILEIRKNQEAEVEKEQEKSTCKICLSKPRDALLLPCMHFDYCFQCLQEHQARCNSCPTCRTPISGTLKSNLSH